MDGDAKSRTKSEMVNMLPTSDICELPSGAVEYARIGSGPCILVSHGTLGGYDQGLAIALLFDGYPYTFVCLSRAGYLRSALDGGRTPQAQAGTDARLLDLLGIEQAVMLGVSGGAPSALAFAQDYPQRCRALVLLSSISAPPSDMPAFFRAMIKMQDFTMRLDPLWKLMYRYGLRITLRMNGLYPDQIKEVMADKTKREIIKGIFRPTATASRRRLGMSNDGDQIENLPEKPSFRVTAPTFISHALNDPLASPDRARHLAKTIQGSHYLILPDGGHVFFVVHRERVVPAIVDFLEGRSIA